MNKDIYITSNNKKSFISIDIKQANATMLKLNCPSIFMKEDSFLKTWEELVKQFTKSEFIVKSKHFREVLFGHSSIGKKLQALSELYMDKLHNLIITEFPHLHLEMKNADECIYSIDDVDAFMLEKDKIFGIVDRIHMHVRIFELNKINNTQDFYYKKFIYSTDWNDITELKIKDTVKLMNIPKYYIAQIIKWYIKERAKLKLKILILPLLLIN